MTKELEALMKSLAWKPNACNWFQFFAQETWDRIGFARTRPGFRIHETTITQNLVFEFHTSKLLYSSMGAWNVEIFESTNESANGNDLEIFLKVNQKYIVFVLQAKMIQHFKSLSDGNYARMNHHNDSGYQIDSLLKYAKKINGIPLYLLYNWVNNTHEPAYKCDIHFGIQQYGCSIVSAETIKSNYFPSGVWSIPKFSDLHPNVALPWFVIPCCFPQMSITEILSELKISLILTSSIQEYTRDEIVQDSNWRPLGLVNNTDFLAQDDNVFNEDEPVEFNPRFRIVVSESQPIIRRK